MRKEAQSQLSGQTQAVFRKLQDIPKRLLVHPAPEDVHGVRTTIRRFQTLAAISVAGKADGFGALLKQLNRIRRRAGKVRDVDVQVAALRTIRSGSKRERNELKQFLQQLHENRARKLARTIKEELADGLEKRLRRAALAFAESADAVQPEALASALAKFASLMTHHPPLSEENLHDFRMDCKRIRYEAEMADGSPAAKKALKQFKRIQDATGIWHDWVNLSDSAEQVAANEHSPLLSAIHAVRQAKFNEALRIVGEARSELLELCAAVSPAGETALAARSNAAGSN